MLAFIAVVALPRAGDAQSSTESIRSYDVRMQIEPDGVLLVREVIIYDFGPNERHGIQRDLVRSERYDDDNDRLYDIDVRVGHHERGDARRRAALR